MKQAFCARRLCSDSSVPSWQLLQLCAPVARFLSTKHNLTLLAQFSSQSPLNLPPISPQSLCSSHAVQASFIRRFDKGQFVFKQGDPVDNFYVITKV